MYGTAIQKIRKWGEEIITLKKIEHNCPLLKGVLHHDFVPKRIVWKEEKRDFTVATVVTNIPQPDDQD